ncbi:conserved hypothetical protein [metagenome]|uniref:Sulfotransferase family protein n=1 Tax=metagenome TaxID=256318 RepID=A0A2P2BXG5_9ZZZZ
MAEPQPDVDRSAGDDASSLVFVLGPGRSGTSTMAGALTLSGYTVPQAIKGNATNPLGFFEPRWVVDFHRTYLRKADVSTLDTDPVALALLERAVAPTEVREELATWLRGRLAKNSHLVIKDPRMVWFKSLWLDVATELGVEPRFVIMLRHPAEVSSSRSTYYDAREVPAVAGWINVALLTERLTRGNRRSLVPYSQLTAEWRPELIRLRDHLDLPLDPPPETTPHPVDDFIDPSLRRMTPDWANVAAPVHLQELAERTFVELSRLAEEGESEAVHAALDSIAAEYAIVHADAVDLVGTTVRRARTDARRRGVRQARNAARAAREEEAATAPQRSGVAALGRRVVARLRSVVRR